MPRHGAPCLVTIAEALATFNWTAPASAFIGIPSDVMRLTSPLTGAAV